MVKILVYLLCLFFILLILNHITFNFETSPIIEPLENPVSTSNTPLILAQQNAGNIQYLKGRFTEVDAISKKVMVDNIKTNSKLAAMKKLIDTNADSIDALVQAHKDNVNKAKAAQDAIADE